MNIDCNTHSCKHVTLGCQVASGLCNRVDRSILIDFLKAIKENVGPIKPSWVMTDDAEQYFSS